MNLRDKVAVVTGAGSGIGREISLLLAARGCSLALVDINLAGADETAQLCRASGHAALEISTHRADVADVKAVQDLAEQVMARHKAVHVVVNNAGVEVMGLLENVPLEQVQWIVGVNFWGVVHGCKVFLPHIRQSGGGQLVNISSMFGFLGVPGQAAYCATKFAVRGFSESLRAELRGSGIGVTAIHPGVIRTNIMSGARGEISERARKTSDFIMRRLATAPTRVAIKVVRAIEHDRPRVRAGWDAYVFDAMARLSPTAGNWLLSLLRDRLL
jgi:NAD(P)-dependent dehydrogenase (short-subunit alcohol dehydrogenase family)